MTIPHLIATFIKVMSFFIAIKSEYGKLNTLFIKLAANAAPEGISYVLNIRNSRHQVRH
ncbi:protein of unknown function [Moritella yayanosii]|uniref:Uncharacterized protein n=1 Tax=Moritella yayanosii TaxID=69539 RepID=A0A330LMC1_9GAMM|nr:protein of unknown function [Moritella yayanosii]